MNNNTKRFLLLCSFLWSTLSIAQPSFLDQLEAPHAAMPQIVEMDNGHLMLAHLFKSDSTQFYNDGIRMLFYNECDQLDFARDYSIPGYFFRLDDLLKSSTGFYFLTGGFIDDEGNRDFFMLKLDALGNEVFFNVYQKPFKEYVYTLDETPDGDLMIFGATYINSSTSRNFFMRLDTEGNIKFSQLYLKAGIWGYGLACEDGGFIGQMGRNIYKIDQTGNLLWGNEFRGTYASSAPIEVEDGYVFVTFRTGVNDNAHFLYKLDKTTGALIWVSEGFRGQGYALLQRAKNGNLLCLDSDNNGLSSEQYQLNLLEFSQEGEQLSNQLLAPTSGPASPYHRDLYVLSDGAIAFASLTRSNVDQILIGKTDVDYELGCDHQDNWNMDTIRQVTYQAITTDILPVQFEVVKSFSPIVEPGSFSSTRLCEQQDFDFPPPQNDTTICDGEELLLDFSLDGATYQWQDQSDAATYLVTTSGRYTVEVEKCGVVEMREVEVTVEDCPCSVKIPNAFTPNGDGRNDVFSVIYDCLLADFRLSVYDRWGKLIFNSNDPDVGWEGTIEGRAAPSAVYIYRYQYLQRGSNREQQVKIGDVSLIR